ncbi:hypothetical protein ABEY30_14390 [Bacillus pacificus]|uniref:hypothetical protein n=1 Tax=Bacillus pacificus TaxID=2026187 RepID=UPI003D19D75F
MNLTKIWLCTSKNSKLHKIYLLQTGDSERKAIFKCFEDDLNRKLKTEQSMDKLNGNALIDDIPYYINLEEIQVTSYLQPFKEKIEEILSDSPPTVLQFSKNPLKREEVTNFEENEGVKFIIVQTDEAFYFLYAPSHSIIKNRVIMSFSITENSTILEVPKGIQIPPVITARFSCVDKKLYVYDVNRFESMLTLNENRKAKSQAVLNKFIQGEYKIASENYIFKGLDDQAVQRKLSTSNRAIRRLSKYQPFQENYSIVQIKDAVSRLDADLRVTFDDDKKVINVTPDTARTFVGIIHNSIVQRLISGEIEIAI